MKVIIFTLFLSSSLELITAPNPPTSYGYDSGRYPVPGGVRRNYSSPKISSTSTKISSRTSPISSSVTEFEKKDYSTDPEIQSLDTVIKSQTEFEPIEIDQPIINSEITIDESSIPTPPSIPPRPKPSILPSTKISVSKQRTSPQVTVNRSRSGNGAKRGPNSQNLNQDYSTDPEIQSPDTVIKSQQTEFEPLDIDQPIIDTQITIDESSIPAQPPISPRPKPSSLPSTGSSISKQRTSPQVTANKSRSGNGAKRGPNSPNLNQNQKSGSKSKSNVQTRRNQNPRTTNKSIGNSTNRANKRSQSNNSSKNLRAVSARSKGSGSAPIMPVDPPQLQDVNGNEEIEPAINEEKNPPQIESYIESEEIEPTKTEEKNPTQISDMTIKTSETTPETNNKPPEKSEPNDDEWEGPKTPEEDKPELYTVDENVKFIRAFTSDMIIEGKYKIGETIMYLLKNKEKELDTADKAAIEYVIKERLRKDPELIEALKKHNEKQKVGPQTGQSSNSNEGQSPDEDMPPYMVEILSPSFSISQFEQTPPKIQEDTTPPPKNKPINNINTPPATTSFGSEHLILPSILSRIHSLFQNDNDEDDTDPFSSGISNFGGGTGIHSSATSPPFSIIRIGSSPQIQNLSNPSLNSKQIFKTNSSPANSPFTSGHFSFPPIQSRFQSIFQNDDNDDHTDPFSSGFGISSFGGGPGIKSAISAPSVSRFQFGTSPQITNYSNPSFNNGKIINKNTSSSPISEHLTFPPIQSQLRTLFQNQASGDDPVPYSSGKLGFEGDTGLKSPKSQPPRSSVPAYKPNFTSNLNPNVRRVGFPRML